MNTADWIGTIGVAMVLIVFYLNIIDKIDNNNLFYLVMNFIGGLLSALASFLIAYWPFFILETIWTLVSGWGIIDYYMKKRVPKNL
jgi:hypothetical protein